MRAQTTQGSGDDPLLLLSREGVGVVPDIIIRRVGITIEERCYQTGLRFIIEVNKTR